VCLLRLLRLLLISLIYLQLLQSIFATIVATIIKCGEMCLKCAQPYLTQIQQTKPTYEGTQDIHGLIIGRGITGLNSF
jgi:hypothetical protein